MSRVGVLATVPWRASAVRIASASLAVQTKRLDRVLLFHDGSALPDPVVVGHLRLLADEVLIEIADECSGGAWERLRRARSRFAASDRLFVFDDDLVYPPTHVAELEHGLPSDDAVVSLGGVLLDGSVRSYNDPTPMGSSARAIHVQLGVCSLPISSLAWVEQDGDLIATGLLRGGFGTEVALGYWWWRHGVTCWLVPRSEAPRPIYTEGGATDPRSLYRVAGPDRLVQAWDALRAQTGWPDTALRPFVSDTI